MYYNFKKVITWDFAKNEKLQKERGVSFDDIIVALEAGQLLDLQEHYNSERYAGQKLMFVRIHDYVYLVPFVEDSEKCFFKTIIPSRKATKDYLR